MIGGYFSFQGINGAARWHKTPVEEALPVTCLPSTIGSRCPKGFAAELVEPDHPVLQGLGGDWPLLLGVNEVELKPEGAGSLAKLPDEEGGHPLLVAGTHGKGRTLAWTSDIGPHWVPDASSPGTAMPAFGAQALDWLTASR